MSYTRPEVVKLAAVKAIQSGVLKTSMYQDADSSKPNIATATAYEADE
jgi:hypothetical protein